MRLIAILTATLICQFAFAQGKTLKIEMDDTFFGYPPDLRFEVLDEINHPLTYTINHL